MFRITGWLYEDGRFREGSVSIEEGIIVDVSRARARTPLARGLILPAFTNAHTHAGDAVVREELTGSLEELVAPPHGLKHRVLAKASDEDVVVATREYLSRMVRSGTAGFWDFREMGLRGLRQLYAAALGVAVKPLVLSRPSTMAYDAKEVAAILRACDGVGISSLLDWEVDEAAKLAKAAHASNKVFATHASERVREDIDSVLDLKPDLLVHLTEATEGDLARVADAGVPVAVCPRSNAFFGKFPDLPRLVQSGVRLLLGTDNAMINTPSMFRELDFAWRIANLKGGVPPRALLDAALAGRSGLRGDSDVALQPGEPADVIVLDVPGSNPTFGGIFRSGEADLGVVAVGGRTWLRQGGSLAEIAPPTGREARTKSRSRAASSRRRRRK